MKIKNNIFAAYFAGVMELVDMLDLGSSAARRGGSTPSPAQTSVNKHANYNKRKKDKVLELSVKVVKDDYFDSYHKVLKSYKRDMLLPGFRKGKVPTGIIEKKYGISIMVDEVNKLVQNKLYDYLKENEVKTLGSPIPNTENKIEWKIGSDFNFVFEVGIYPDIKAVISKKDKLDFFLIEPEKQTIDNYVNDISKRYGKMESHKLSKEGDVLFCKINQIDGNGEIIKNGITNEASITTEYIDSEKEKNKFISLKQKDKVKAKCEKSIYKYGRPFCDA